jgi:hypothetical protein
MAVPIASPGPGRLEVGIFDGTHGWLRIRADLDAAGTVSASLTASDSAHASLRSALPEMAKYLGMEAVRVNSIEVHRFSSASSADRGQSNQSGAGNSGPSDNTHPRSGRSAPAKSTATLNEPGPSWSLGPPASGHGGWLNVCA